MVETVRVVISYDLYKILVNLGKQMREEVANSKGIRKNPVTNIMVSKKLAEMINKGKL